MQGGTDVGYDGDIDESYIAVEATMNGHSDVCYEEGLEVDEKRGPGLEARKDWAGGEHSLQLAASHTDLGRDCKETLASHSQTVAQIPIDVDSRHDRIIAGWLEHGVVTANGKHPVTRIGRVAKPVAKRESSNEMTVRIEDKGIRRQLSLTRQAPTRNVESGYDA